MPLFADRSDAGRQLSSRLMHFKVQDPVILALPRGGVPVAFEIAQALAAPLDLIMVRKIGVPWQPVLAAAAMVDGDNPQIVENSDVVAMLGLSEDVIQEEARHELKEIERRRQLYLRRRVRVTLKGRTAIEGGAEVPESRANPSCGAAPREKWYGGRRGIGTEARKVDAE